MYIDIVNLVIQFFFFYIADLYHGKIDRFKSKTRYLHIFSFLL